MVSPYPSPSAPESYADVPPAEHPGTPRGVTTSAGPESPAAGYGGSDTPLPVYAGVMATFGATATAAGVAAWRTGRMPERIPWSDLALVSVGVHRLARLIAKDRVTS